MSITTLSFLKEAGKVERQLSEIACERTLKRLEPYAGYPEVAKMIDYVQSYRTDIPSTHMVFKFIEGLETAKANREKVEDVVRNNLDKKGLLSPKQKELLEQSRKNKAKKQKELSKDEEEEIKKELEKCFKNAGNLESMIVELEKQCDLTWEFFNKNANSVSRVAKSYKITAIRNMLSILKGNLRALKASR